MSVIASKVFFKWILAITESHTEHWICQISSILLLWFSFPLSVVTRERKLVKGQNSVKGLILASAIFSENVVNSLNSKPVNKSVLKVILYYSLTRILSQLIVWYFISIHHCWINFLSNKRSTQFQNSCVMANTTIQQCTCSWITQCYVHQATQLHEEIQNIPHASIGQKITCRLTIA